MKVQHTIKVQRAEALDTMCGREIAVNGAGAPCKACARTQASQDAASGTPEVSDTIAMPGDTEVIDGVTYGKHSGLPIFPNTVATVDPGEPEWSALDHADMNGQHVTILGRNIIAGEWEYEVRDFHGNAHSERSYVTAELLKPWVDGLIDTSVTRYLIRTFGFTAQEASDAVRDFAEIVEKGERMGSRTYFIGDAVAEAWEAARLNRKCPVGSRLYRERDGATGTVTAIEYTGWIRFVLDNGTEYLRTATEVQDMGFEVITAAELAGITGDAEHPVATMRPRSFRKVKDARSARARRGGAR